MERLTIWLYICCAVSEDMTFATTRWPFIQSASSVTTAFSGSGNTKTPSIVWFVSFLNV